MALAGLSDSTPRTLVVGAGALGGLIATRLAANGTPVWLSVREEAQARTLTAGGLSVTGVGGDAFFEAPPAATLADYETGGAGGFDFIVLATKAHAALEIGPRAAALLRPEGVLLPLQNGGVSERLIERLGTGGLVGAVSNLGATMHGPGRYEQRNAGHFLIGEVRGGATARAERVQRWLRPVEARVTGNLPGAIWSKLLINCAVTTLGAVAGLTMREYLRHPAGRLLFERTYAEALAVAVASGIRLETMLVEPVPPTGDAAYDGWLRRVLGAYGDLKPSMLQDFERGKLTEVEFINGYVVDVGRRVGVATPANQAIVAAVQAISTERRQPSPALHSEIWASLRHPPSGPNI
jgi:2-dehydropantoate 2-reductase